MLSRTQRPREKKDAAYAVIHRKRCVGMSLKEKLKSAPKKDGWFARRILEPTYRIYSGSKLRFFIRYRPHMNDKKYIVGMYKAEFGKKPDLVNPKSFNEKNNWRKLYDRENLYTLLADKFRIKEIIAERCGAEHTFPLLGVWDEPEDIDFDLLPDKFVLKNNHSGGVIVCRDKARFNKAEAVEELKRGKRVDYSAMCREWPYKNIERRIIAEQYMGENLIDFKNYCFDGKLAYTFVWRNV